MRRVVIFGSQGRMGRLAFLLNTAILMVFASIFWLAVAGLPKGNLVLALILFSVIAVIWTAMALQVKRLHDMNMSGWYVLWIWSLATAIGEVDGPAHTVSCAFYFLVLAWLGSMPGSAGPNRFGERRDAALASALSAAGKGSPPG